MEDLLQQSKLFEWGGISFSDEEWYKIRMAMKKILMENYLWISSFFWKNIWNIFRLLYNSGIIKNLSNEKSSSSCRIKRKWRYKSIYFLSNSILESWYELPDITHEQIVCSRRFKYHLTGDLNSKVKSFLSFPGKEMHLFKCQIISLNLISKEEKEIIINFPSFQVSKKQ